MKPRKLHRIATGQVWLLLSTALALGFAPGAKAQANKVLQPERAFAFSVQPLDDKSVEARFTIASGYYLYREKLKFTVEQGTLAAPEFPAGIVKEDQFFGRVETYRDRVAVRLAVGGLPPGSEITVKAESQGCADLGICYPPNVQKVSVALPMAGARPGAEVWANPEKKSWFN